MYYNPKRYVTMPLGIVIRRTPGATRWPKWSWRVSGILDGAGEAKAQILRQDGDVIEYHDATVPLEIHGADTESAIVAI